jgi:hypothetical protein
MNESYFSNLFYPSPFLFQALNRLLSMEGEEGGDSPEMVAGRLEIRVVSSPLPDGCVNMSTTPVGIALGKREEALANTEEDEEKLPGLQLPPSGSGSSSQQTKLLKSILKNKPENGPGEKAALRIDTKLSLRRNSADDNQNDSNKEQTTPDVCGVTELVTANDFIQSKTEDFQSARGTIPDLL